MSFVWKAPQRLKSPEQVARELLDVAKARGLDEFAAVLAAMCVAQESDFWCPWNRKDPTSHDYPFDSESDDGRSVGYFQQQNRNDDPADDVTDWWGLMASRMDLKRAADVFYERLEANYRDSIHDPDIASRRFIQNVQGSAYPGAYAQHWDRAWQLVRAAAANPTAPQPQPQPEVTVAISGDPVWLEPVWREALGDRLVVHEGWQDYGAGGVMGVIWGTMVHHTANDNERVEVIRDGVQQPSGWLPGPLSQALLTRDGKLHLIAVGPCNHAGGGNWKDLDDGNGRAIGIECAYDGDPIRWPDSMIITLRDACAAVSKHLGKRADDSVCGHKEYAKPAGRKVDPGNMSMDWLRGEVQKDIDGFVFPGEQLTTPQPHVAPIDFTKEIWDQLRIAWPQLGDRTLVDTVGAIGEKLGVEGCYDAKAAD